MLDARIAKSIKFQLYAGCCWLYGVFHVYTYQICFTVSCIHIYSLYITSSRHVYSYFLEPSQSVSSLIIIIHYKREGKEKALYETERKTEREKGRKRKWFDERKNMEGEKFLLFFDGVGMQASMHSNIPKKVEKSNQISFKIWHLSTSSILYM